MFTFPRAAEPLLSAFSVAFSARTFQRVVLLFQGAILSLRRRTISAILTTLGPLAPGHWSDNSRVLCRASWSLWLLGRVLAAMILEFVPKYQAVVIPVDDATSRWSAASIRKSNCTTRRRNSQAGPKAVAHG